MNWDRFVGLDYAEGGRGPAFDCWGLFCAAFEAGTELCLKPDAPMRDEWIEVALGDERAFDGAVLRLAGTLHIGIIVARSQLLHARRGRMSSIEPLSRYERNSLELFRHRALVGASIERDRRSSD